MSQSIHHLFQQQKIIFAEESPQQKKFSFKTKIRKLKEKRSLTHDFFPHKLVKPSPMKHGCLLPSQKVDNAKQ